MDSKLWLIYMHQSLQIQPPSSASEPRPFKCYDFNFKGFCQRNNYFYKHQCLHCDKNHPATKCFSYKNRLTFRSAGTQQALRPQAQGRAPVACQPQPPSHFDTLNIAATPIDVNKLRELLLTYPIHWLHRVFLQGSNCVMRVLEFLQLVTISNP